jgi:hypothetical protein
MLFKNLRPVITAIEPTPGTSVHVHPDTSLPGQLCVYEYVYDDAV